MSVAPGRRTCICPATLLEQLEGYFRLLGAWNAKINLTALDLVREPDKAVDRLLIEPLVAARYLDRVSATAIDIGSGGGSPAIPMKLARPDVAFTLVEAKTRKCAFLREAGRQLGVELRVETARYEVLLAGRSSTRRSTFARCARCGWIRRCCWVCRRS